MKILSASQIKEADKYTIEHEPISSLQLMERAARALCHEFQKQFSARQSLAIFCGMGNNGGDGLAMGRLLHLRGYRVQLYIIQHSRQGSPDFQTNRSVARRQGLSMHHLKEGDPWPQLPASCLVVDAILGSGLSRPLEGFLEEVVHYLNQLPNPKLAVDIATGLFADDNSANDLTKVLRANRSYSLQQPKLSQLHFHSVQQSGALCVVPIGLHPDFLEQAESHLHFLQQADFIRIHQPRQKHSYKGSYGHALLVAGSRASMGAAIMSATACLRSGAGLLTVHVPESGRGALNSSLPEAMLSLDEEQHFSHCQPPDGIKAIGLGPGLGQHKDTAKGIADLLQSTKQQMVWDADALNLLSEHPEWYAQLKELAILTPHPGELKRLLGVDELGHDYLDRLREFSQKHRVVVVLKYSLSVIATPGGELYFVDEGSAALASPGSGDVLTGVILGLLASGYPLEEAAMLGVYLQGRAGSLAGEDLSLESALASDVICRLPRAFRSLC